MELFSSIYDPQIPLFSSMMKLTMTKVSNKPSSVLIDTQDRLILTYHTVSFSHQSCSRPHLANEETESPNFKWPWKLNNTVSHWWFIFNLYHILETPAVCVQYVYAFICVWVCVPICYLQRQADTRYGIFHSIILCFIPLAQHLLLCLVLGWWWQTLANILSPAPHNARFIDMCRHAQILPCVVGIQPQDSCLCSKCSDPLSCLLSLKNLCSHVATHKKEDPT